MAQPRSEEQRNEVAKAVRDLRDGAQELAMDWWGVIADPQPTVPMLWRVYESTVRLIAQLRGFRLFTDLTDEEEDALDQIDHDLHTLLYKTMDYIDEHAPRRASNDGDN